MQAAKTHLKKLQIIQNKHFKIINNKHWRFSTQLLHKRTSIIDLIKIINIKYLESTENSLYQQISECRESVENYF